MWPQTTLDNRMAVAHLTNTDPQKSGLLLLLGGSQEGFGP